MFLCNKSVIVFLLIVYPYFLFAQIKALQDTSSVTIAPTIQKPPAQFLKNIEMTQLYKELNHFSTLAPLGELLSGKQYIFSADINPLFIFSNSIRSRWNVGIGARVMARMFQDSSYPVRTPSYIPTLKVYYSLSNQQEEYTFIEASFSHHSNGQDGPSKIGGEWNDRNGNFSTNWLALSFNWGNNAGNFRNHYSLYGIQHINLGEALSQDDSLAGYYGQTRVGFDFQRRFIQQVSIKDKKTRETYFTYLKERLRLHAYTTVVVRGQYNYPNNEWYRRVNTELKLHYLLKSFREGGFFAGLGYYGEDPYNIYFHNHYFFVKAGIAAGIAYFKAENK